MDKLSAPRYMMPMIASSCQHCDEQHVQTLTVMCTLHDFLGSKVRFIHTSTVIRQHSCPGKNTPTSRVHLVMHTMRQCPLQIFRFPFCFRNYSKPSSSLLLILHFHFVRLPDVLYLQNTPFRMTLHFLYSI